LRNNEQPAAALPFKSSRDLPFLITPCSAMSRAIVPLDGETISSRPQLAALSWREYGLAN
jgi:hypothetical protein